MIRILKTLISSKLSTSSLLCFILLIHWSCKNDVIEKGSSQNLFIYKANQSVLNDHNFEILLLITDQNGDVVNNLKINSVETRILKNEMSSGERFNFYELVKDLTRNTFILTAYINLLPGIIDNSSVLCNGNSISVEINSEAAITLRSNPCQVVAVNTGTKNFQIEYNSNYSGLFFKSRLNEYAFITDLNKNQLFLKSVVFKPLKVTTIKTDFTSNNYFFLVTAVTTRGETYGIQSSVESDIDNSKQELDVLYPEDNVFNRFRTFISYIDQNQNIFENDIYGNLPDKISPYHLSGDILSNNLENFSLRFDGDADFIRSEWVGITQDGISRIIVFFSANEPELKVNSPVADFLKSETGFLFSQATFRGAAVSDSKEINSYDQYMGLFLNRNGKSLFESNVEIRSKILR